MTQTINQTEQVQKYAEQLCETLIEARAAWMKSIRFDKEDGNYNDRYLDEDGNYKPEDHPDYFTFIIGKRYLKVVVMEYKTMHNMAESTPPLRVMLPLVFTLSSTKTQAMFSRPPLGAPPRKA